MRTGSRGELVPLHGFSRVAWRAQDPISLQAVASLWVSSDQLRVVSALEQAHLPGSGEPPQIGPQWHISLSRAAAPDRPSARCKVGAADVARAVGAFGMPAFEEDNHHPGIARHLWCPVDERYRVECECKLSELTIADGDYLWTTDTHEECRGCWYARMFGPPCTIHAGAL